MEASGRSLDGFLNRNRLGDWGDLDDGDRELNDQALFDGFRLMTVYSTVQGERIWLITDVVADDGRRASTSLLLPTEY